jgi:hypothetical protein
MIRRLQLLVVLIVLGQTFCGNLAFGQSGMSPDAAAILERYRQSLSWMESVSMKIDIYGVPTGIPDKGPVGATLVFRYDHGRAEWRGRIFSYDKDGNIDPNINLTIGNIFTNDRYVSFDTPVNEPLRRAFVSKDTNEHLQRALDDSGKGSPLWGRIYGNDYKSVADLLAESSDLTTHQETLDGFTCCVLQGTSKYGKAIAWVAPQMGYSALKWSIEKRKGIDLFGDKLSPMDSWVAVFDSVKFQEINGWFVPTAGVFVLTEVPNKDMGEIIVRDEYTISVVQLNPDFDSMGAFRIDLPNGTRIYVEGAQGIRYKWKDGLVVADVDGPTFKEIDKTINQLKN